MPHAVRDTHGLVDELDSVRSDFDACIARTKLGQVVTGGLLFA